MFTSGCSNVGSFTFASNYTLYVDLWNVDIDTSNNTSKIGYNVFCKSNSNSGVFEAKHRLYFEIDGKVKRDEEPTINSGRPGYVSIASGTTDAIQHDNDGNKSVKFIAVINAKSYGVSSRCEGWFSLERINRYANYTTYELSSIGLTYVDVKYRPDRQLSAAQYSLNDGNWTNISVIDGTWYSPDGDTIFRVSGLEPDTQYRVKMRIQYAGALWNEAVNKWFYTLDKARVTSWTQLTLPPPPASDSENAATINFIYNNQSGANARFYLERNNDGGGDYNSSITYNNISGYDKSGTLTLSSAAINKIYEKHSNITTQYNNANQRGTSGMMITACTNDSYYTHYGVTFILNKDNCGPTGIKAITLSETNFSIAALTGTSGKTYTDGTNFKILNNYSNVRIDVPAKPLTVRASATQKSVSINGGPLQDSNVATSRTINKVNSGNFSVVAYDSRDFSYAKNISCNLISYIPTTITNFSIDRPSNLDSTNGLLTFNGVCTATNFGAKTNAIQKVTLLLKTKNVAWTNTKVTGTKNIDNTKVNSYDITSLFSTKAGSISLTNQVLKVSGSSGDNIIFNLTTDYDARIIVADMITNISDFSNEQVQKDVSISSGKILFSAIKNEGVCFGTFYDSSVGGPLQVNKKEVLGAEIISTWNY